MFATFAMNGMIRIPVKRSILRYDTGLCLTPVHLIDIDDSVNLTKAHQKALNDLSS